MCFHTKPVLAAPRPDASVTIQPKPILKPTPPPPPTSEASPSATEAVASLAHVRFASTDEVGFRTALRASPSTIYSVKEDGKK